MYNRYRRRNGWGYRKWHACTNCRSWPSWDYEEAQWEPRGRDICNECKKAIEQGTCGAGRGWF